MNEKQKAEWELTRAKGIWRYVLVKWVLKGLLPSFLAIFAGNYLGAFHSKIQIGDLLFVLLPFFLISGVFVGVLAWGWNETMYK